MLPQTEMESDMVHGLISTVSANEFLILWVNMKEPNNFKRTYYLSGLALKRLEQIRKETGLKHSTIIDRLILGLPVGQKSS